MIIKSKKDKSNISLNERKSSFKQFYKILFISILLVSFTLKSSLANEGLETVFHVYSEGNYIGVLSDDTIIDQIEKEMLKEAATKYVDQSLSIGSNLTVVQERVFTAGADDALVLDKISELLSVQADAIGLYIDNELVLNLKDISDYNEVIRELKLQAVTEDELSAYELQKLSSTPIPPLKENETRLANIIISSEIDTKKEQVKPEDIMTVNDAITYLNKGTLEEKKYSIQAGDHVGKIANNYNMPTAKLLEINPGLTPETILRIGDELSITAVEPFLEVEVHYETKSVQLIKHEHTKEEDNSTYKGVTKLKQEGSDGKKEITELIRKKNGQVVGKSVIEENILTEAKDQITIVGTKVTPSRGVGTFMWPAAGGYVSSQMGRRWGRSHDGIDIARPSSFTIKASDNGVVKFAGWDSTYGNKVIINHNNGYETLYAHLSAINVKVGQILPQGASLGVMGSTGRSTGVHLHFEVRKNGSLVNPLTVLR
ncbi:peptidoglycan DD-metalloendopeptidase family protein [Sporosarcina sp. FA9]|uniref:peptidoglycan DD-metalloendopeptidase family protein n=1 Tax=Sporosarcina sp. FA9 TaxID=3413030 RepID=UPI003F66088D